MVDELLDQVEGGNPPFLLLQVHLGLCLSSLQVIIQAGPTIEEWFLAWLLASRFKITFAALIDCKCKHTCFGTLQKTQEKDFADPG